MADEKWREVAVPEDEEEAAVVLGTCPPPQTCPPPYLP